MGEAERKGCARFGGASRASRSALSEAKDAEAASRASSRHPLRPRTLDAPASSSWSVNNPRPRCSAASRVSGARPSSPITDLMRAPTRVRMSLGSIRSVSKSRRLRQVAHMQKSQSNLNGLLATVFSLSRSGFGDVYACLRSSVSSPCAPTRRTRIYSPPRITYRSSTSRSARTCLSHSSSLPKWWRRYTFEDYSEEITRTSTTGGASSTSLWSSVCGSPSCFT